MKSKFISAAVLAVSAFVSMGASAEMYNSWLFDQMAAPATKTRAEVKAEVIQAQQQGGVAASAYYGATAQQQIGTVPAEKAGTAPLANAELVKTSQQ
ncbi:MAG: DUF4148 domain-containing protein [Pseudomonadota bacterium]